MQTSAREQCHPRFVVIGSQGLSEKVATSCGRSRTRRFSWVYVACEIHLEFKCSMFCTAWPTSLKIWIMEVNFPAGHRYLSAHNNELQCCASAKGSGHQTNEDISYQLRRVSSVGTVKGATTGQGCSPPQVTTWAGLPFCGSNTKQDPQWRHIFFDVAKLNLILPFLFFS